MADPEFGSAQSKELQRVLGEMLRTSPMEVIRGERVVEVRLRSAHKGKVLPMVLEGLDAESMILAMGDDRTDEDLFAALSPQGGAIHVGKTKSTQAGGRLEDPGVARAFLHDTLDLRRSWHLPGRPSGVEPGKP